jgi:nucleoside-diphosphate-sugar epimerase
MKFTIFGATGFIGSHVAKHLSSEGHQILCPSRDFWSKHNNLLEKENLENVIYCIGMTANFRNDLTGTIDAHVSLLNHLFKFYELESITYLSSTRVYESALSTNEISRLLINPTASEQVYNVSKLTAESLCLALCPTAKIIRLSNVYGAEFKSKNFLSSVFREATNQKKVTFHTSPNSAKDYVSIDDVTKLVSVIVTQGQNKIYNVASGENTENRTISDYLRTQNVNVDYATDAPEWKFIPIDNSKIKNEFGFNPQRLEDNLPKLYEYYLQRSKNGSN